MIQPKLEGTRHAGHSHGPHSKLVNRVRKKKNIPGARDADVSRAPVVVVVAHVVVVESVVVLLLLAAIVVVVVEPVVVVVLLSSLSSCGQFGG